MRSAFICAILCVCGSAFAGEEASVLAPTPAAAPAVVVANDCGNNCCNSCACETARVARTRTRYRVVSEGCDACTGRSVRSVSRGVVRGAGAVVEGVGVAAVNVITLPARVCRAGRCGCN